MWFRAKKPELPWTPEQQLLALPIRNAKAEVASEDAERAELRVAQVHRGLAKLFSRPLRLRDHRVWELTGLDLLLHRWSDGRTTVAEMIERVHRDEKLGWNEARAVVLSYLPRLVQRGLIIVAKPA